MKLLLFALTCIFFTGCAKFKGTNTSVWAEGLWIIPTLFVAGIVLLFLSGMKSIKSGSEQQGISGRMEDTPGNVKFTSTWQFKFIIALAAALIGIIIYQNSQA